MTLDYLAERVKELESALRGMDQTAARMTERAERAEKRVEELEEEIDNELENR